MLATIVAGIGIVACDFNSHTEPNLDYNKAEILGDEIYINESDLKAEGIDSLYINTGDTLLLTLTTRLLNAPDYQWNIQDDTIFEIVPFADDPLSFYAVAKADSGATTSFILTDPANEASKEMHVIVTSRWADPDLYIPLGAFNGHFYYISRTKVTWAEAKYNCELAGGYLPSIGSQEEQTFLFDSMMDQDMGATWIGIQYEPTDDGGFSLKKWINGDDLTYEYFRSKDGTGGYRALYFFAMTTSRSGIWSNYPVAQRFVHFLEME